MKVLIAIFFILTAVTSFLKAQTGTEGKELYPIVEDGLWGYIDHSGQIIIEPQFLSAGQFSEGFASVRLNGTYGYINKNGAFIIQPQYDVAHSFEGGQAKVYLDGKPYYIDQKGDRTFEHNFAEIQGFGANDYSLVVSKGENYGVINKQGKLLVDTIYKQISKFSDGIAIVIGQNHNPYPDKRKKAVFESGVITSTGEFIVPFGKYKTISEFKNGFARVELIVKHQKRPQRLA